MICSKEGNYADVNILVVHEKPLEYDSLIGIDTVWALGSTEIMPSREVKVGRKHELGAAITIEEPDFCTSFDHKKQSWTMRWKWTRNEAPDQLHNTLSL